MSRKLFTAVPDPSEMLDIWVGRTRLLLDTGVSTHWSWIPRGARALEKQAEMQFIPVQLKPYRHPDALHHCLIAGIKTQALSQREHRRFGVQS